MKRIRIDQEQKKFFHANGFIAFDALVSKQDALELWKCIQLRQSEFPGLTPANLTRSFPLIERLARQLAQVAAALLDRKPIRLAHDCVITCLEQVPHIQEREIALLISPSGNGLFFTHVSHLYKEKEECYLLLVFTANYLNNPIVYYG